MISIVVPIYNTPEAFLRESLGNLDLPEDPRFEVCLIDDGSEDYVKEICMEFVNANKNFKYYYQNNGGVSKARNTGIFKSIGDWIIFVDPDDNFCIKRFLDSIEMIKFNGDIFFLGYETFIDQNIKINGYIASNLIDIVEYENVKKESKGYYLVEKLLKVSEDYSKNQGFYLGTPWAKIFRKQFLEENNLLFDEILRKRQDALFCAKCYSLNPKVEVDRTDTIIYQYRIDNNDSITKKYNSKIKHIYLYLFQQMEIIIGNSNYKNTESLSLYAYDLTKELINLDFCNVNNEKSFRIRKNDFETFVNDKLIRDYLVKIKGGNMKVWKKILYKFISINNFYLINLIFIGRKIRRGVRNFD